MKERSEIETILETLWAIRNDDKFYFMEYGKELINNNMSKKKQEEALEEMMRLDESDGIYQITLKGLIWNVVQDVELSKDIVDTIELYMRRHHAKGGHPGIVLNLDTNNFEFVTLRHSEDE